MGRGAIMDFILFILAMGSGLWWWIDYAVCKPMVLENFWHGVIFVVLCVAFALTGRK
jgi:hypothetical protein